jgi:hypothetical protein
MILLALCLWECQQPTGGQTAAASAAGAPRTRVWVPGAVGWTMSMPKPQSAAVHQTTGPRRVPHTAPPRHFDPPPPGGHLSIAHPPRRRPAIVLIRAFHPQVARPSDPVHRTKRPGALSAAEDFLASHSIVGMTLDRQACIWAQSRSASLSLNEYGMRYIADDRLGWRADVGLLPADKCVLVLTTLWRAESLNGRAALDPSTLSRAGCS